jgi:citrate lyase subunit beta/citryl-CoA lyase
VTDVPPLTWLYVPADRPDRIEKAIASRAHAVIVDLEDAVAPVAKEAARAGLAALLDKARTKPVHVRINALGTPYAEDDLAAVARLAGVVAVNLPKVERPEDAQHVTAVLASLGAAKEVHCLIESAAGVEAAFAIASCDGVAGISLGEADLAGETGATGSGLDWARSRIVNAACAAGLPRPPQTVYPDIRDDEGLRESCLLGRRLGYLGRTAIHPAQLATIESVYLPTAAEAKQARELVASFDEHVDAGTGAYALPDGAFVDAAFVRAARQTLALAERHGTSDP